MAEKMYEVVASKFVGKHKIYKKGEKLPGSEIMGGEAGLKLALEGQKGAKASRNRSLPDVARTLKVAQAAKK